MIPRVPDHLREEIIRLRDLRMPDADIGRMTRLHPNTVRAICRDHFSSAVERWKAYTRREVALARSEMHSAPLYHPERWG